MRRHAIERSFGGSRWCTATDFHGPLPEEQDGCSALTAADPPNTQSYVADAAALGRSTHETSLTCTKCSQCCWRASTKGHCSLGCGGDWKRRQRYHGQWRTRLQRRQCTASAARADGAGGDALISHTDAGAGPADLVRCQPVTLQQSAASRRQGCCCDDYDSSCISLKVMLRYNGCVLRPHVKNSRRMPAN